MWSIKVNKHQMVSWRAVMLASLQYTVMLKRCLLRVDCFVKTLTSEIICKLTSDLSEKTMTILPAFIKMPALEMITIFFQPPSLCLIAFNCCLMIWGFWAIVFHTRGIGSLLKIIVSLFRLSHKGSCSCCLIDKLVIVAVIFTITNNTDLEHSQIFYI